MIQNYFLKMIQYLRENEEVMLWEELLDVSEKDATEVIAYLKIQYANEVLDYPYQAPAFDEKAALWGAKTIYIAAQLLLYRENNAREIPDLLKIFENDITISSILSADLSLRFLPDIITQLEMIDSEDPLIEILEKFLVTWHFSGISYLKDADLLDLNLIKSDNCLFQLYCNRVIYFKNLIFLKRDELKNHILANLGNYKTEFWNEINLGMVSNA